MSTIVAIALLASAAAFLAFAALVLASGMASLVMLASAAFGPATPD